MGTVKEIVEQFKKGSVSYAFIQDKGGNIIYSDFISDIPERFYDLKIVDIHVGFITKTKKAYLEFWITT